MPSRIIDFMVGKAVDEFAWSYKIGEYLDYDRKNHCISVYKRDDDPVNASQKEWNETLMETFFVARGMMYKTSLIGSQRLFIMINPKITPLFRNFEREFNGIVLESNDDDVVNSIPHMQNPEFMLGSMTYVYLDDALPYDMIIVSDFEYPEYAFKVGRYCVVHLEQLPSEYK